MFEERIVGTDDSPEHLARFSYSNHLGSAALELDESAQIISYEEYHPYGTTSYQAMNANNTLTATASVRIDAPAAKVWKALTTPELIGQYLMGTHVTTDWKEGSPITYEGSYNGKSYHDKGVIKKLVPEKLLQSTYWSSMGGKEDKPENYNLVTYELSDKDGQTQVTLTQDNVLSEKEKEHVTGNWNAVLQKLKEVVERE